RNQPLARKLRAERVVGTDAASSQSNSSSQSTDISGEWVMRVGEEPKVSFWRAAFKQQGSRAKGTIIPVSGDWGEMTDSFENNQLNLNRFAGINSLVCKAPPTPRGARDESA